jgi:hypothetical protein
MNATVIIIIIAAIVALGLYKTLKRGDGTPGVHGGAGHEHEHTGEAAEPRPDDQDHDEKLEE